ncbi:MAG: EAL domain-containing protein [Gammaproteobacteria bacterium]|nr:EAL domain-containing protein [Gammaproteobacteria bacterium]
MTTMKWVTKETGSTGIGSKEADYILQLSSADHQLLAQYKNFLAQGSADFAEQYYNFLFDNPAMAEVLYGYELQGGDIGELIRRHLTQFLQLLEGDADAVTAYNVGVNHARFKVKPLWVMGGYRLFLNHLQQLIELSPDIHIEQRTQLLDVLLKQVFREMGFVLQGYWESLIEDMSPENVDTEETFKEKELLDHLPMMFWSIDVINGQLLYGDENMGADIPYLDQVLKEDRKLFIKAWDEAMQGHSVQIECQLKKKHQKNPLWHRVLMYPVQDEAGKVTRIDGFLEDVHKDKLEKDHLQNAAYVDEVTGLVNRSVWMDRLEQSLTTARRSGNQQTVLMLLDLDHFKMVNDTLGNTVGNELLRQVALRMDQILRDTDTVARLSEDEFGVILPLVNSAEVAGDLVANKIMACFDQPFQCDAETLYMDAGLGIAIYPDHADNSTDLYKCAEIAMYRAKSSDRRYSFYEAIDGVGTGLHDQLRSALERREFDLHYQPKVNMSGGRLSGVEALLRWHHPEEGLVRPDGFIQLAEKMGLMIPITDWVLSTALKQSNDWKNQGFDVPVAVNISARTFQNPHLLDRLVNVLKDADVEGSRLELDITENTLMMDTRNSIEILAKLHDLGIAISVDDYGTGSSSLSYLQKLPINYLKIDRSFLQPEGGKQQSIVNSIIDVGHNMGCQVVAEGVEDNDAWDMLAAMGCDAAQGYHISRPLTTESFPSWAEAAANTAIQ